MEYIIKLDHQFFLWLNGFHLDWLDPVMVLVTKTQFWIPLYLLIVYFIFNTYRKSGWIVLAGLLLVILITDRTTTTLMKPYFERLRPSHEPLLAGLVHIVNGDRSGLYGFASSHAANTFGVAMFGWCALRKHKKYTWVLFVWAALMSYSRIYLGLHYPGDILVGMGIGLLTGWALAKVVGKRVPKINGLLPAQ
jgi:undecaprenyl-diphosphatase